MKEYRWQSALCVSQLQFQVLTSAEIYDFCIRQMLRKLRTSAGVVVGMFISMMIFMLGLNCFVLCRNVGIDSVNSVDYEYMYMLKFPEESFPESWEVCYAESLPLWLSARLFAYRCPRPPLTRSIPGRLPMLPAGWTYGSSGIFIRWFLQGLCWFIFCQVRWSGGR